MACITIGNKSFTQSLTISGDTSKELMPQTCCGLPLGYYEVLAMAEEGWNLANQGQGYQPENGEGETWTPEIQASPDVKIIDAAGLTRTVHPNSGIQLEAGAYKVEVT